MLKQDQDISYSTKPIQLPLSVEDLNAMTNNLEIPNPLWAAYCIGDEVEKIKGSNWKGKVVGFYSTTLTPRGYAIESSSEKGSVQIYPESAITPLNTKMLKRNI